MPQDVSSNEAPTVSVIVPCYNSERTIRQCLTALTHQNTSVSYDVIVVDSSSDQTSGIVETDFPSVRLIRLHQRAFPGAARNAAIKSTAAPYCLMVDSDCVAKPDVIERMMARHGEGDYAAVGGSLANGTPASPSGWIGYLLEFKEFMPSAPKRFLGMVPTANVMYKRSALEQAGLFDDELRASEDILINSTITGAGGIILFDPDVEVTHLNRTGWSNVIRYQLPLGRSSAIVRRRIGLSGQLLLRHPLLIALAPAVRLLRAIHWLAKHDWKALAVLLCLWPMYLAAASVWAYGFMKGARSNESD